MSSYIITLRDYFIAHAPTEPQPWFKPTMPPRPDDTIWTSDDGMRMYTSEYAATEKEGERYHRFNEQAIEAWDIEYQKQLLVQWPIAWADEMLHARDI